MLLCVLFAAVALANQEVRIGYKTSEFGIKHERSATIAVLLPDTVTTSDYVKIRYEKTSGGVQYLWWGTSTTKPSSMNADRPMDNAFFTLETSDVLAVDFCWQVTSAYRSAGEMPLQVLGECETSSGCLETTDARVAAAWIVSPIGSVFSANGCPSTYSMPSFLLPTGADEFDGWGAWMASATRATASGIPNNQLIYPPMKIVASPSSDFYFMAEFYTGSSMQVITCVTEDVSSWESDDVTTVYTTLPFDDSICRCYPSTFGACDEDETSDADFSFDLGMSNNGTMYMIAWAHTATGGVTNDIRYAAAIDHEPSPAAFVQPLVVLLAALALLI